MEKSKEVYSIVVDKEKTLRYDKSDYDLVVDESGMVIISRLKPRETVAMFNQWLRWFVDRRVQKR